MIFKGDNSQGELNGFLDAGSHLQGELRFEDTFRIDGRFVGKITSTGDLLLGEGAEIEAQLDVGRVFVSGRVVGEIKASRRVEISARGRVEASITTPSLVIEEGAFFEGSCTMSPSRQKEAPPLKPPVPIRQS